MSHTEAQRSIIADTIREAQVTQGLTQKQLAKKATLDVRTLRKILKKESVKEYTLFCFYKALDLTWPPDLDVQIKNKPVIELGGYSKEALGHYEGSYKIYRNDFSDTELISKSFGQIQWSEEENCYKFYEARANSYHFGKLFYSPHINLVHLVSTYLGAVRTITLSRLDMTKEMMHGSITTQVDRGLAFQPCVSPIIFIKETSDLKEVDDIPSPVSVSKADGTEYTDIKAELDETVEKWVKFTI